MFSVEGLGNVGAQKDIVDIVALLQPMAKGLAETLFCSTITVYYGVQKSSIQN